MGIVQLLMNEMSRGILVVDENLLALAKELAKLNIRIITPNKGQADQVIKRILLGHRIFVTNNTKHFKDDITAYEYGIISTEDVKSYEPIKLANMISKALTEYKLWSIGRNFILTLKPSGKHNLELINDKGNSKINKKDLGKIK